MAAKISTGLVKFFLVERGYGFITSDDDDQDYFFHFTGIVGKSVLAKGEPVSFEIEVGKRGPKAINIQRLS